MGQKEKKDKEDQTQDIPGEFPPPAGELCDAIRKGDETVFSKYYEDTARGVVARVYRVTRDYEEAWNIVQDTFAKLWQQRESLDPGRSLGGFVSVMAVNAAINARNRKNLHAKYHAEQLFLQDEKDRDTADTLLLLEETERLIEEIIRNMSPQRRMVFELHRKEGLSYNEIAERMNLSHETVKYYMKLALQEVRSALSFLSILLSL